MVARAAPPARRCRQLRFRSLEGNDYDFRWKHHRQAVADAEKTGQSIWQSLSDDPILKLANLQWLIAEMGQQIERCDQGLQKAKQQRRQGDLDQRDFEADQRHWLTSQDRWEGHRSDVERAWDRLLEEMVAAMPVAVVTTIAAASWPWRSATWPTVASSSVGVPITGTTKP